MFLGEWLNGRVAVSKTVGCVFESRLPCQIASSFHLVLLLFYEKEQDFFLLFFVGGACET